MIDSAAISAVWIFNNMANEAPWTNQKRPLRRGLLRRLITWTLGLGLLGLIAYGLKAKPIEVETVAIAEGPLTVHVVEEGRTRVKHRYIVSTPVAGQIQRITLRPGDEVKAGQTVITTISPSPSALLDPRSLAQAEARVATTTTALDQAKASIAKAQTVDRFAQSNWLRVQNINDRGSLSITDREEAERLASTSKQDVQAAEIALRIAEHELAQSKAALLQSGGSASESSVSVTSPIAGKVLRVIQEQSSTLAPGVPLIEIGDTKDLEVEVEILSRDVINIKPGADVQIEQWGGPSVLTGKVRLIEPSAFTKTSALGVEEQRVLVICDIDSPPEQRSALGDRYRVEVRIATWTTAKCRLIPTGALFREGNAWKTFVLEQGLATAKVIRLGHTDGSHSEVLEGPTPEGVARVLLHPPDTVKDGSQVVERLIAK
jgi:HlyD family secretion protein